MGGRWYDLQEGASCFLMEACMPGPAGVPLSLAAGGERLALGCSGGCIATMPATASLDPQVCTCAQANRLNLRSLTACCQYQYLCHMHVIRRTGESEEPWHLRMNTECSAWQVRWVVSAEMQAAATSCDEPLPVRSTVLSQSML